MNAEHILLTIIMALSAWTLQSVVKLREQLASLPCRKCPLPRTAVACLALVFTLHLSADPVTNASSDFDFPAASLETVMAASSTNKAITFGDLVEQMRGSGNAGSDDSSSSSISSSTAILGGGIPWQELFNWLAGVTLPALFALWRKHAANSKRAAALLEAVVQGVEVASRAIGQEGGTVKRAIRNQAVDAGVQPQLDKLVQKVTQNP